MCFEATPFIKACTPNIRRPQHPATSSSASASTTVQSTPSQIIAAMPHLLDLFKYLSAMPRPTLNSLTGAHWCLIIVSIVLLFRISFAAPEGCREWDPTVHAPGVDFEAVLDGLARLGANEEERADGRDKPTAEQGARVRKETDVVAASRVVMEVLLRRYREKKLRLEQEKAQSALNAAALAPSSQTTTATEWHYDSFDASQMPSVAYNAFFKHAAADSPAIGGCPMLDRSMRQTIREWSGEPYISGSMGSQLEHAWPIANAADVNTGQLTYPLAPTEASDHEIESTVDFNDADIWASLSTSWPDFSTRFWGGTGI
jgi:hypothetical protein